MKEEDKKRRSELNNCIGVYLIFSDNGKHYVGSTNRLRKRITEHFSALSRGVHHSSKLQNFYNKYGNESLTFCVMSENIENIDIARDEEQKLIHELNSYKNGFNNTDKVLISATMPKEVRDLIGRKAKIRQSTPEAKEALRIANSGSKNPGSKLTNEDIEYIRLNYKEKSLKRNNSKELSEKFNVHTSTILRVVKNRTYKA